MKSDLKITYPGSEKVYINGTIHPSIRVGMRKVTQMPTISIVDGNRIEETNPAIYYIRKIKMYKKSNQKVQIHATI